MSHPLQVTMLGTFSLRLGDQVIDDRNNRMRKVWLLLAYLIYSRNTSMTQDRYLSLLQGAGSDDSADPNGRLKAMFYRARTMLNQLGTDAGHDLIIRKNGTYAWNTDIPLTLDVEEFERLCQAAAAADNEDSRLALYQQALQLYKGDFLPKLSMEPWVMPISAYYHQMYLDAAEQTLSLLENREQWAPAAQLCEQALQIEPYSEALFYHLMQSRLKLNDRAGVIRAYEDMSELLFSTFGVMPSDECRALYREASREVGAPTVPVASVRDQLREPPGSKGAMFCEFDFFKLLYQVQARSILRSGDTIHIALFSLHALGSKALSRRSLDRAMDNLQELMCGALRQGDIITRCSVSQLIVMLPQANYEDSCKVCQRILRAFSRQYPHSPVDIHFSVQPLEPLAPLSHVTE